MVKIALTWINNGVWLLMENNVIHKWHSLTLEDTAGLMMQSVVHLLMYLTVILKMVRYAKRPKMQLFVLLKIIQHVYKMLDIIVIIHLIWLVAI